MTGRERKTAGGRGPPLVRIVSSIPTEEALRIPGSDGGETEILRRGWGREGETAGETEDRDWDRSQNKREEGGRGSGVGKGDSGVRN